jgi:predicted protein tyrosine phosphatase
MKLTPAGFSFMMPPIVKVWNRHTFEKQDISEQFQYAVSIQEYDEIPNVVRPDYRGQRLNLYFFDTERTEEPGYPQKSDIDQLMRFSEKWVGLARDDPFSARLVIHCFAGVSRSAACAMLPLTLYYDDYHMASEHLYDRYPYVFPNTLILKIIKELLGYSY